MTALLLSFISSPTLVGILAAIVGGLGWGFHQRLAGAKAERAKQAAAEAKARGVFDQVDNDVGAIPPAQARDELKSWSKS